MNAAANFAMRDCSDHLAVDARQRAAQAAVVGIEYGGGFRHNRRAASTRRVSWNSKIKPLRNRR